MDRLWPLARPTYLTSTPPPLEHRSSCSTVHQDERGLSALIVSRARGHLALCRVPFLAQIAALIDPQDCSKDDRVWTSMMEWNRSWTGSSILLIGAYYLKVLIVYFSFFFLCVWEERYVKLFVNFITRMVRKKGKVCIPRNFAICSGEEIIIQPVISSYFEMNFPSLFRLQCLLCSFISISLYFHSTENLCHRLWQTCLRFDHDTYQKSW